MSVTLRGPEWFIEPTLPDDSPNPFWDDLLYLGIRAVARSSQISIDVLSGEAVISGITDTRKLNVAKVTALASAGVESTGIEFFVRLLPANITDNVPAYVPEATDDNDDPRTWQNWNDGAHTPLELDESGSTYHYVSTASFGTPLVGTVIEQLVAGGFTLKTASEMAVIVAANA